MYTHLEAVSPGGGLNEVYVGPYWQVIQTKKLRKETVELSNLTTLKSMCACTHSLTSSSSLLWAKETSASLPWSSTEEAWANFLQTSAPWGRKGRDNNHILCTYCVTGVCYSSWNLKVCFKVASKQPQNVFKKTLSGGRACLRFVSKKHGLAWQALLFTPDLKSCINPYTYTHNTSIDTCVHVHIQRQMIRAPFDKVSHS